MFKKLIAFSSAALLLLSQSTALVSAQEEASNENFPLTEETVELNFFVGKGPQSNVADWQDHRFWNMYEEMTNVHIVWDQVANEAIEEQRNLVLVSGDLPDVFYSSNFPSTDIYRYGQQGVFLPLNDLIEEHAPNLFAMMEEYPEIRNAITYPDGNIYSIPYVFDPNFVALRAGAMPWISRSALETTGLEVPETTEEFYEYLVAVQEQVPDVVPFGAPNMDNIYNFIIGSFGVNLQGSSNGPVQLNEEGQVEFYANSDRYREALEYLNRLYSEGLIDQSIYSIDWNTYVANQNSGGYASYIFWGPGNAEMEEWDANYDSMPALEGPHGDQIYTDYSVVVPTVGAYILTSANEHPELSLQWIDYFFSQEGSELFYRGVEGETFEEIDGVAQFTPNVVEEGIVHYLPWLGNNQGAVLESTFIGGENTPVSKAAAEKLEPFVNQPWSPFTYTAEENQYLISEGADIERYITESRDNFIAGQLSFDEWDNYVQTLESMNIARYVEVKQAAYDRNQELEQ